MTNKNLPTALPQSEIFFYETESGKISVELKLEQHTLWMNLNQITSLFERDKSVISRHLKNIFEEEELERDSVVAFFATTALDNKIYQVEYYNLDAILSVGYRVNSKRGTKFRQWASSILTEYLVNGYTLNESKITNTKLQELQNTIDFLSINLLSQASNEEGIRNIIDLIRDYTKTWSTLLEYDENRVFSDEKSKQADLLDLDYEEAVSAIQNFKDDLFQKGEASELFGKIRDDGLKSILYNISQTFDSQPLYTSNLERAACILYFVIKNHPFVDGNKRIGAFLFMFFLEKIGVKRKNISQNTLVAIALLVATSDPKDKDLMMQLIRKLVCM